jgi:quercetin 2,3-dioxygenase
MITLRRAEERHHEKGRKQEVWLTFHGKGGAGAFADGFEALELLDESRLAPGTVSPLHLRRNAEIVTYVLEGAVAHEDSTGRSNVIGAGEFQSMSTKRGIRHSQTNASRTDWAHVFHVWLRPSQSELDPSCTQKRFYAADRRGVLCAVASHDGRSGSLIIHRDAVIYSATLDPGQHLVHELPPGRSAWLHVVVGEARLGDAVLTTGDGAAITTDRAVSLTAGTETEILLIDLQQDLAPPRDVH